MRLMECTRTLYCFHEETRKVSVPTLSFEVELSDFHKSSLSANTKNEEERREKMDCWMDGRKKSR